jgi:ABC-type multidrug transport system permease subunit
MLRAFRILFRNELLTLIKTPSALFWIFGFPIFFLAMMLFSYGREGVVGPVTIEIVDHDQSPLSESYLERIQRLFVSGDVIAGDVMRPEAAAPVGAGHIRVTVPQGFSTAIGSGDDTLVRIEYNLAGGLITQVATKVFGPLTTAFNAEVGQLPMPVKLRFVNATGVPPVGFSQYMATGILVLSMISVGMSSTCVVIATRREQNTFKLMSCLPLGKGSYLLAIIGARILVIIPASLILLFSAVYIFKLNLDLQALHVVNAMILTVIGGFAMLSLGVLLAARVSTVDMANLLSTFIYILLLFLSDLAMPIRNYAPWLRDIFSTLPTAQFAAALRAVLVQGASLGDEWRAIGIMLLWSIVFLSAARINFRWQRL